jgi:HAD superfamily hydrolase (TIGR01509 family)
VADIALVLFDLNGVLYQYDRAARIDALAAVSGLGADAIKAAVWDSGFEDSGDAGALDASGYLHGFGAAIGYDLSEADWVAALRNAIAPIPATLALLPQIRPAVACAVLTNNNLLVQKHFSTLYPEVAARVGNRAFVSAEFGARKPDPEVYRACLARLSVKPEAALFIDDSEANVTGAQSAGLSGHLSAGPDDLEAELRTRGILV